MDWETAKPVDLSLDGIKISVERRDTRVESITLTDKAGHTVRLGHRDYQGITLYRPAKAKEVDAFVVKGEVIGLKVSETFETEHEANRRADALGEAPGAAVKVEKTKISGQPENDDSEIPF
jgi:hypothetical protein